MQPAPLNQRGIRCAAVARDGFGGNQAEVPYERTPTMTRQSIRGGGARYNQHRGYRDIENDVKGRFQGDRKGREPPFSSSKSPRKP